MRPRGEIRELLFAGFCERQAAATWREVLPVTGVDVRSPAEVTLVRRTVENMVRAGELQRADEPGERARMARYRPAVRAGDAPAAAARSEGLEDVARSWAEFV